MVGIMHEWVLDPAAYDLARAAPALIDTFLAGLVAQPPRRARPCRVRRVASRRLLVSGAERQSRGHGIIARSVTTFAGTAMSTIRTVGVIGAGTMGNGIAQACAVAGHRRRDGRRRATPRVQRGVATIGGSLDRLVKKDKLTADATRRGAGAHHAARPTTRR